MMYFVLHEYLGALDFKLAGKAFNVPPTTIRTWYDEKNYWDKFMPFLNELTGEEVIQAVKHDEVKAIFLGSL